MMRSRRSRSPGSSASSGYVKLHTDSDDGGSLLSSDSSSHYGDSGGQLVADLEQLVARHTFPILSSLRVLQTPWLWAEDLTEVSFACMTELAGVPQQAAVALLQPVLVQLLSAWQLFAGHEGGEALALMNLALVPGLAQVGLWSLQSDLDEGTRADG